MLGTGNILNHGRYRIDSVLDNSATGGAYRAYDIVKKREVTLRESVRSIGKVLTSAQLAEINTAFAGVAQELMVMRHDAILAVLDYFSEIDRQYLVLESIDDEALSKYLFQGAERPETSAVLRWMEQIFSALDYLHKRNPTVVHGDIKPENLKTLGPDRVKLTTPTLTKDTHFGGQTVARKTDVHYQPFEVLYERLDPTSQRVLLRDYDERSTALLMRPVDARSDIYAAAACFYHLLTGTMPNDALDRSISILDGNGDPVRPPDQIDDRVPKAISAILMRCLQIRREDRYDSAESTLRELRVCMNAMAPAQTTAETAAQVAAVSEEKDECVDNVFAPGLPSVEQPKALADNGIRTTVDEDDLLGLGSGFEPASRLYSDEPRYEPAVPTGPEKYVGFEAVEPVPSLFARFRVAFVAAGCLALAGTGFIVLRFISESSAENMPVAPPAQTAIQFERPPVAQPPAQKPEAQVPPTAVKVEEPLPEPAFTPSEPTEARRVEKNKQTPPQIAMEKPKKIAAPKPAATPKKTLTVEDLLRDN